PRPLRVRPAGGVGVAGEVAAGRAVDGPAAVQFEQVLVLDRILFLDPAVEQRAEIFDDPRALLDFLGGEQTEPGAGAADAKGFSGRDGGHHTDKRYDRWSVPEEGRCSNAIPRKWHAFRQAISNRPQIACVIPDITR